MIKKIIAFGGILLLHLGVNAQVTILSTLYSQNYWQPNRSPFTGQLETWWTDIVSSGVKYMRVGGIAYDATNNSTGTNHVWTASELCTTTTGIIDVIRSHGIEPILQVPIDITATVAQNCTTAYNLITAINITNSKNIIYWEIGNEPNTAYSGTNNYNTDAQIQAYIKQVSTTMKGVSSTIKIIGPSFSSYDYTRYHNFLGGTYDITGSGANGYYIDYIDFHAYPFQNECYWQTGSSTCAPGYTAPTRTDVISNITASGKFKDNLADIISHIPTGRTSSLGISVTEANISYEQDRNNSGVTDLGPGSFLGGQYWAEMTAAALEKGVASLSMWSPIEGTSGNNYLTDCGYIGTQTLQKRANYWHYQLMANNFTGTYYPCTGVSGPTPANYKAFACSTGSEIRVLIMNQDQQSSPRGTDNSVETFTINFNSSLQTSGTINFKFAMGNSNINGGGCSGGTYCCSIQKEATMLLVFDAGSGGSLLRSKTYTLQDALRGAGDIGPNSYVGTALPTITSSSSYTSNRSNNANIYSTISIAGTSAIAPTAVGNNVFQFTTSATIDGTTGTFYSGATGNTLCITAADATCH